MEPRKKNTYRKKTNERVWFEEKSMAWYFRWVGVNNCCYSYFFFCTIHFFVHLPSSLRSWLCVHFLFRSSCEARDFDSNIYHMQDVIARSRNFARFDEKQKKEATRSKMCRNGGSAELCHTNNSCILWYRKCDKDNKSHNYYAAIVIQNINNIRQRAFF